MKRYLLTWAITLGPEDCPDDTDTPLKERLARAARRILLEQEGFGENWSVEDLSNGRIEIIEIK